MKTQSSDTSPEAEQVLIELARRMPVWRKVQLAERWGATLRGIIKADILKSRPNADAEELHRAFVERWLAPDLARDFLRARAQRRCEH
jgi:hypothetical protein